MPPSALTLAITESTALEDPDRVAAQFALLRWFAETADHLARAFEAACDAAQGSTSRARRP